MRVFLDQWISGSKMVKMNVAIIPAKEHSSEVPNKNSRIFHGYSLVQWSILSANIDRIDKIFVSTDSTKIIQQSQVMNLDKVEILSRPSGLTLSQVQVDEVVLFSIRQIEAIYGENSVKTVVVLQPTSLFRRAEHVAGAYRHYKSSMGNPLFSGYYSKNYHYYVDFSIADPIKHNPLKRSGRQELRLNQLFVENGAIYIASAKYITENKTFRAKKMSAYEMSALDSVQIDSESDWFLAEQFMLYGKDKNEDNS